MYLFFLIYSTDNLKIGSSFKLSFSLFIKLMSDINNIPALDVDYYLGII